MYRRFRQSLATFCIAGLTGHAAAAQQTGTLRGVIVDSMTRQPIARVLVQPTPVAQDSEAAVLTDTTGHFTFTNVPAGSLQIRYRRPGYFDSGSRQPEAMRTLSFVPGSPEPTFALEPSATVQGQVVLPEGEPPAGIRVELLQAVVTGGHRYWRQRDTMPVETDGSFEFAGLEPGSYLLHSQASLDPAMEQLSTQARSGYVPLFAPGNRDIETASPIQLEAGQTAAVKLNLLRAMFRPVAVQVSGASGASPNFEVSGSGFTHWPARFNRQTSSVTMELPSGDYLLRVSGGRREPLSGTLPLHVTEGPSPALSLAVGSSPPVTIAIQAVSASTTAIPAAGMQLSRLALLPVDSPQSQPIEAQLEQDPANNVAIIRNGVPAGRYWVEPAASGGYVAQLTSRGIDLLEEPLSISQGAAAEIDATLRDDGGAITVTRAGDLLGEDNVIQVIPLFAGGRDQRHSSSNGGSISDPVSFTNLPPGDYLVLATSSLVGIAYREPSVLQQLKGTRVTVTAGVATQVTLSTLSAVPPGVTGAP